MEAQFTEATQERRGHSVDPMLVCLAHVMALNEEVVDPLSLGSGFGKDEYGYVKREEMSDIAARFGFVATWLNIPLLSIPEDLFPVVYDTTDGRAVVVLGVNKESLAVRMLTSDTGLGESNIPLAAFEKISYGQALLVKPRVRHNERSLTPLGEKSFEWFWGTLWRFRGFYIESMFATVIANILTLASIFFSMNVYDRVVPTRAYASLWTLALGTITAILLEFFLRHMKAKLIDIGSKKADTVINATLFREMMSIRLDHKPVSIGSFTSSMQSFESLRDFFSSASMVALTDFPFIFLYLALIFIMAGPLALVPMLAVPFVLFIGYATQKPLERATRENTKQTSERQSVLIESMLNLETVKMNNAESFMQRRWDAANDAGTVTYQKTRGLTNFILGFSTSMNTMVSTIMIVYGVYLIHDGSITQGALIAGVMLAGRIIAPLTSVMGLATRYQQARMSLETLEGLIKRPRDRNFSKNYINLPAVNGKIRVQHVSFAYPVVDASPVLRDINLNIEAGQKLALLGRIGSGKSTLLKVVAGLYPAGKDGVVFIDDLDTRQIDPISIRKNIGYLGQDAQLFYGTLRENLTLGDKFITDSQVVAVLQALDIYSIVTSNPKGLDMMLHEAGGGLSGGQMQMIAIARMMLRNPKIILLDEPTANMDQNTENRVIKVLGDWMANKTLILVTHRPHLLDWVNRIGVIDKGVLVIEGERNAVLEQLSKGISAAPTQQQPPQQQAPQQAQPVHAPQQAQPVQTPRQVQPVPTPQQAQPVHAPQQAQPVQAPRIVAM